MVALKEYVREFTCRNHDLALTNVYSVTNSNGFVPSAEYFNKEVFSKDLSSYKIVKRGMLAYNPSRINVGSIDCLRSETAVIVSPLYVVFQVDESRLLPEFINAFLHSSVAKTQIKCLTSGSVRDSLKFSALVKMQLNVPSISVQRKVLDKIAQLRELVQLRERQLTILSDLVKSRFVEAA